MIDTILESNTTIEYQANARKHKMIYIDSDA